VSWEIRQWVYIISLRVEFPPEGGGEDYRNGTVGARKKTFGWKEGVVVLTCTQMHGGAGVLEVSGGVPSLLDRGRGQQGRPQ